MTKNANFVSHKKSKQKNQDGTPQLPLASALVEGEIAINFAENVETLSIKNESGNVVTFSSDNYYSEKKLGSAFTGANSAVTVTDVIEENEEIIATALNDLNERKLDASAYTPSVELWEAGGGNNAAVLKNSSGTASGDFAVAEGRKTSATSYDSHAEGYGTLASNYQSHAEGYSTSATSYQSHAEGYSTLASGYCSHAEGSSTIASGYCSHAEGQNTKAFGDQSHAEGQSTSATSYQSHAEGYSTLASGSHSHAEGSNTTANGSYSHAEGFITLASGYYSHAEGQQASATSQSSHAEGSYTIASDSYSHAEGYSTSAASQGSHAEGYQTKASSSASHSEGRSTIASGAYSHSEGYQTLASNSYSHAEGNGTIASGGESHAEGYSTSATNSSSHAEGSSTLASGDYSHAEGYSTKASGESSHAEGYNTKAIGSRSHAEGYNTTASGNSSHAEGVGTQAIGSRSHAEGRETIANNDSEHASGQYNISNSATTTFGDSGNTLFSVGNGTADNARHNAFEIRQNGDIYIVSGGSEILLQDNLGGNITIDQVIDSGTSASTNAVATSAVYGFVTSYTPSITVDQVLDNTTSASTNPVSSKAVYDAVTDNELVWTNAYVTLSGVVSSHTENTNIHLANGDREKIDSIGTLSGTVTAHTANTEIHVTAADKTAWNAKVDASAIADFFDDAKYEDSGTTKVINFYHGNTIKATIDASDFIVDGMVDDVRIENGNLVIDFNTASGKQDISIPLTDIFDPSNYYNKTAIDNLVGSGFTSSSITDVIIENEEIVSAALTDLDNKKLDASAYTPTDLSNYYTKSETSGATQISNALSAKVNSATYTGHTADTTIHFTTGTVQTQIDNSISGKVNTSDIVSAITPSNSASTAPIATKVVAENELVMSNALTDLDERKLDASAYTEVNASSAITSMAGYSMPQATSAIVTGDTLNQAIGKLETRFDGIRLLQISQTDYDNLQSKDPYTLYIITD